MIMPFEGTDILWMGFESGRVAVSHAASSSTDRLEIISCSPEEAHTLRVNAIIFCPSQEIDGTIWTRGEDGTLNV